MSRPLNERLDLVMHRSGLPPALIGHLFGFDGRTLKSWRMKGVPKERERIVLTQVERLERLIESRKLPMDLLELAVIGLNKLEEDNG